MVYSEVDIVNLALGRIAEAPIAGFDDPTATAQKAASAYPMMRDSLQRRYRWNFTKARVVLSPVSEAPPFGETKYYQRPSDYVATLGAYESGWGNEGGYSGQTDLLRIEGDKILWPGQNLNLYYIRNVTQESLFDPLFTDALAWSLGREFALSVANDAKKAQLCEEMFRGIIKQARIANAMESAPEVITASEWLDGRWHGAYGYRAMNRYSPDVPQPNPSPVIAPTPPTDTWEFD